MNVEIHIDRLVLDGIDVPFAARPALQAAIESELARLVAGGGIAVRGAVPSLRAPEIRANDPHLGHAIAGAVFSASTANGGKK